MRRRSRHATWLAALAWLWIASPGLAHDGPPYPILVDRAAGPVLLSVWADPDVGTGTYHVYLEPLGDDRPLPDGCEVQVFVQPASGRLPERGYRAEALRISKDRHHYLGEVQFDAQEQWRTRIVVGCAGEAGEADTLVEVTPPGQGPVLDFVLYLFPFVAVAVLIVRALIVGRRRQRPPASGTTSR